MVILYIITSLFPSFLMTKKTILISLGPFVLVYRFNVLVIFCFYVYCRLLCLPENMNRTLKKNPTKLFEWSLGGTLSEVYPLPLPPHRRPKWSPSVDILLTQNPMAKCLIFFIKTA